jgi:hypothetical protein
MIVVPRKEKEKEMELEQGPAITIFTEDEVIDEEKVTAEKLTFKKLFENMKSNLISLFQEEEDKKFS